MKCTDMGIIKPHIFHSFKELNFLINNFFAHLMEKSLYFQFCVYIFRFLHWNWIIANAVLCFEDMLRDRRFLEFIFMYFT